MKPYIYLRGLRHVDLSVFCVESGPRGEKCGVRCSCRKGVSLKVERTLTNKKSADNMFF